MGRHISGTPPGANTLTVVTDVLHGSGSEIQITNLALRVPYTPESMPDIIHTDSDDIKNRISNNIEEQTPKNVNVRELVESIAQDAETRIEDGTNGIDAVWQVIEDRAPSLGMSHTQRVYTIAFLFTNYGLSPEYLTDDDRVKHGDTWDEITKTLCEYALYEVSYALATNALEPAEHDIGDFNDSRENAVRRDYSRELRSDPMLKADVHNWIAILSSQVSTVLANHHDIPSDERTDVQQAITDQEVGTESAAIMDVMEEEAAHELDAMGLIETASFLDALEQLYGMDGSESIESGQLEDETILGWEHAVQQGVRWDAMKTAIEIHRETFAADFKHRLDE